MSAQFDQLVPLLRSAAEIDSAPCPLFVREAEATNPKNLPFKKALRAWLVAFDGV